MYFFVVVFLHDKVDRHTKLCSIIVLLFLCYVHHSVLHLVVLLIEKVQRRATKIILEIRNHSYHAPSNAIP